MPLLAGREFDDRDDARASPEGWPYRVAVVNETFAKRYFGGANPIGRHIGIGDDPGTPTPIEIVGLVKRHAKYTGIREDDRAAGVLPLPAGDDRGRDRLCADRRRRRTP